MPAAVMTSIRRAPRSARWSASLPRTSRCRVGIWTARSDLGSRAGVDLSYARTDMRAQGLTRQRALLSLDCCEDTQGL